MTPVDQFGEEGANPKLQPREGLINRTRRVGKEEGVLNCREAWLRRRGRGLRQPNWEGSAPLGAGGQWLSSLYFS